MTTEIVGSSYNNSPNEDVFAKFAKTKTGSIVLTDHGALERAKIAADHGFIVDPVTGKGFWFAAVLNNQVRFDPTKKNGGV